MLSNDSNVSKGKKKKSCQVLVHYYIKKYKLQLLYVKARTPISNNSDNSIVVVVLVVVVKQFVSAKSKCFVKFR